MITSSVILLKSRAFLKIRVPQDGKRLVPEWGWLYISKLSLNDCKLTLKSMCPQRWAMEDSVITRPPPVFFILSNSRLVNRKWPKWFTPNSMPYPSSVRPSATNPGDIFEQWFLKSLYFLDLLKLVFSRFFSVSIEQTNHHCCCSSLKTVFACLFDRYGNCDELVSLSSGLHQFVV